MEPFNGSGDFWDTGRALGDYGVHVGSRGPITMLVYRLWYRRELAFTIHDAVAATIPIHAPFIPFNIE